MLVPTTCERRPGDLRALFFRNLAKVEEGAAIDGVCKVPVAQNALEDLCQFEVVGPLGEGASGTLSGPTRPRGPVPVRSRRPARREGVQHSIGSVLGDSAWEIALKETREVKLILTRSKSSAR